MGGGRTGQHGWHGTLAPGIYRTARDRFRNTGTYNSQSGHLSSPHPAHPQNSIGWSRISQWDLSSVHSICPLPGVGPLQREKECQLPRLPRPHPGPYPVHTATRVPLPQPFWNASLGTPARKAAGMCTGNHRAGRMQQRKACSPAWVRPHPLPSRARDRAGSHPSTQSQRTHERKQTKREESHPGWRRAETPLGGRGLRPGVLQASEDENGKGEGERQR